MCYQIKVKCNDKVVDFRAKSPKRVFEKAAEYIQGSGVFCRVLHERKQGEAELSFRYFINGVEETWVGMFPVCNMSSHITCLNRVIQDVMVFTGETAYPYYYSKNYDGFQYGKGLSNG